MSSSVVRVAIALSGGVDSAVAALFLHRCIQHWCDVEALINLKHPPPLGKLQEAIKYSQPLSEVVSCTILKYQHDPKAVMHYFPIFMKNWEDNFEGVEINNNNNNNKRGSWCESSQQDYNDATDVAHMIGILPHEENLQMYNYSACYVEKCFEPMLNAYARGGTLNVDVLCNSKVKFNVLLHNLLSTGKAQYLATGHYARTVYLNNFSFINNKNIIKTGNDEISVLTGPVIARPFSAERDLNDQTLFLSKLSQFQVSRAIFPLGHLFERKIDVREVASQFGFKKVSEKKTSTGICFIGEYYKKSFNGNSRCFSSFLEEYIAPNDLDLHRLTKSGAQTSFINAETGDTIESSDILLQNYCNRLLLPAYSLTLGQMIRGKKSNGKYIKYYVQGKEFFPFKENEINKEEINKMDTTNISNNEEDENENSVRYLRTVRLVKCWNHPLLYQSIVKLKGLTIKINPKYLLKENGKIEIYCSCCVRHQDPLRSAKLFFTENDIYTKDDYIYVKYATVLFNEPVRALTPGQTLVAYWPITESSVDKPDAANWFVLASGWII